MLNMMTEVSMNLLFKHCMYKNPTNPTVQLLRIWTPWHENAFIDRVEED